jgi:acetyl-CoA carboxylase carboxyl transferase subunit alpha
MSRLKTPIICTVIGEGGSGGALALTMADRILMQQNAMYAITSPEGAAAILFRDRDRAPEVAEALGVSAGELLELGVIDEIVPEPTGGAHVDPEGAIRMLEPMVRRALAEAMRGRGANRRQHREDRLRGLGGEQGPGPRLLRNIGDVLGDAFGGAAGKAGALGSRLRRGRHSENGGAETEPAVEADPVS